VRRRGAAIAVLAACLAGALALGARDGGDSGAKHYEIVLDNAFGLAQGGDFKIAGVRAGKTGDMNIEGQAHPLAVVDVDVTEPGLADLRRDARCEVRPQSFIGEYFIDCQPGTSPDRLPDGGRVPVEHTSSTIGLDLVNNILRRPYRDRLRLIVGELGTGLAGRGADLNDVIRRAHPGLRETSQTLRILGRQTRQIDSLIVNADRVIGALEEHKTEVSRFVRDAAHTAETASTRREALAEGFRRLPAFLEQLQPYMGQLGDLAQAQQPVLRNLGAASGDLDTFLKRLRPFAQAGTPAFQALGSASVVGRKAVEESTPELNELRLLAQDAPGVAKPLRQFLQTLDDRKRAVEPDPRAAATDPPAPDKTHITGSGGFTGMEALWNYFYWQALSTNGLDDIGHVLRLNIVIALACTNYATNPGNKIGDIPCNQFLGPTQPGVLTPDPTRPKGSSPPSPAAAVAAAPATPVATRQAKIPDDAGLLDYLLAP
jgi:phospholipid/cholesterol/gamma-HCH transport system substrate-binding protein